MDDSPPTSYLWTVGGFTDGLGRVGSRPLGCEETELCIRLSKALPEAILLIDDEAIIAGFLNGEREALETVEGWIERAASPFRRRLFSHWDDLQQAARMEVTRLLRQGKFRGESSLKTYLWQVVNHACINHVRALSRQPSVDLESISQRPSSSDGSPLGSGPPTDPLPSEPGNLPRHAASARCIKHIDGDVQFAFQQHGNLPCYLIRAAPRRPGIDQSNGLAGKRFWPLTACE